MAVAESRDLRTYCLAVARRAKAASAELAQVGGKQKQDWLRRAAVLLRQRSSDLQAANARDLAAAPSFKLDNAQIDRLRLTPKVIESMAVALEEIAQQPNPVGEVIESTVRPNGLE